MMFRWFLAFRYLFSRAIPFAALIVVAASVALLIVIVSVMEGFRTEHHEKIRGTSADIQVSSTQYVGLRDPDRVAAVIDQVEGVRATAPYVDTPVLYRPEPARLFGDDLERRYLRAIDIEKEFDAARGLGNFADYIAEAQKVTGFPPEGVDPRALFTREWGKNGMWDALNPDRNRSLPNRFANVPLEEIPIPVVVGTEHARDGVYPGYELSLTAFSPSTKLPVTRRFLVTGYFKTGIYELDARGLLISLSVADGFFGLQSEDGKALVSGVRVAALPELHEEPSLSQLRMRIETALEEAGIFFIRVQTWREEHASLLQALRVEKALTSLILGLTVLFGGFMIFTILTVQVVEKTRDIGVLQSMGVTPWEGAGIFVRIGVVLCAVGTIIGSMYGLAFAYFVNDIQRWVKLLTGIEVFPLTVFYMDEIPVRFHFADLASIIIPTVVVSFIASLLPAYRAARQKPVDALRYE